MDLHMPHSLVLAAACVTWLALGICMRYYFRGARRRNRAKTWLTLAASACTLTQVAALALVAAPLEALSWIALAGYAATNALFWGALATHGRERPAFAFLSDTPARLKTTGPYRLVRHPIYSAYLLGWISGVVATACWWLLICPAFMVVLYYRAARAEERALLAGPIGEEYHVYCQRTGMFMPKLAA
jgi:protein-S-isoprenylcysteine O-methyltransferase Ste14